MEATVVAGIAKERAKTSADAMVQGLDVQVRSAIKTV
jgi:hypothetical protein